MIFFVIAEVYAGAKYSPLEKATVFSTSFQCNCKLAWLLNWWESTFLKKSSKLKERLKYKVKIHTYLSESCFTQKHDLQQIEL